MDHHSYEDLSVGDRFEFGGRTMTKSDIIAFADRYDPMPFHIDEEAANYSIFEGLCASGWHTVSVANRLIVTDVYSNLDIQGGKGADDVRWHHPVRPGDTISGWVEVLEKSESESDDGRGYVRLGLTVVNQDDTKVLSYTNQCVMARNTG